MFWIVVKDKFERSRIRFARYYHEKNYDFLSEMWQQYIQAGNLELIVIQVSEYIKQFENVAVVYDDQLLVDEVAQMCI